ncbi:MAG TPA: hypothetical protein PLP75_05075 [Burkholderiales bacterium]|nr:hypothetical protein [Burkholderiales bacterium]
MKTSTKIKSQATNSQQYFFPKLTAVTLILLALSGCNDGGVKSSASTQQDNLRAVFNQRNAIILKAIKEGKAISLPSELKTPQEVEVSSWGANGSRLGKPGLNSSNAVLSGDSCLIPYGDMFAPENYSRSDKIPEALTITSDKASKSVSQTMAISAALSGGYSLFSASASASYNSDSLFNEDEIGFEFVASAGGLHQLISTNYGKDYPTFFNSIYLTNGNLNPSFYNNCGDSFVNSEQYMAQVKGLVTIKLSNSAEASEFGATLDASYGSFASLSAEIKSAEKATNQKATIQVHVSQIGGDPGALTNAVDSTVVTCSVDDFTSCQNIMNKLIEYSKTLPSQITDSTTKEILPNKVAYLNPSLATYEGVIGKINESGTSPEGKAAIEKLQNLYLNTVKLYATLKGSLSGLSNAANTNITNDLLYQLELREEYISSQSSLCYIDTEQCAKTILPLIIQNINTNFPINLEELDFYSKVYTAKNFLNLNSKLGGATAESQISVKLFPNDKFTKDGESQFSYSNGEIASKVAKCSSAICQPSGLSIIVYPYSSNGISYYDITFEEISALKYRCEDKLSDHTMLSCHGYNRSLDNQQESGNYKWEDTITANYIANYSRAKLEQIANPR